MKKIALIGASGSIGTQSIDVIRNNKEDFLLTAISVGSNTKYAKKLLDEFKSIEILCISNEVDLNIFEKYNIKKVHGEAGLEELANFNNYDIMITAVVGFVGLKPTIAAIKNKKDIALANKETLVTAGHIIMPLAKKYGVSILPVDSEHSAIFQCLNGEKTSEIRKLIITASGGSFRDKTRKELKTVTKKQALNHPNWSMGEKITIDSATMFNKGLEVIEAHHLYGIDYDNIDVLVHRESIVHSMIEFVDSSVMAQLGSADMRVPIQYALTYPNRMNLVNKKNLDLAKIATLNFEKPDVIRFPALQMAYNAGKIGHSMPTVLNASNEVAVDLFLREKIKFLEIENIVKKAMDTHELLKEPSIKEIVQLDKEIREMIRGWYNDK